jgi:hypothetical protein
MTIPAGMEYPSLVVLPLSTPLGLIWTKRAGCPELRASVRQEYTAAVGTVVVGQPLISSLTPQSLPPAGTGGYLTVLADRDGGIDVPQAHSTPAIITRVHARRIVAIVTGWTTNCHLTPDRCA